MATEKKKITIPAPDSKDRPLGYYPNFSMLSQAKDKKTWKQRVNWYPSSDYIRK